MVLSLPGQVTWSKLTNLCELLQLLIGGDQPECLIGRGRFRSSPSSSHRREGLPFLPISPQGQLRPSLWGLTYALWPRRGVCSWPKSSGWRQSLPSPTEHPQDIMVLFPMAFPEREPSLLRCLMRCSQMAPTDHHIPSSAQFPAMWACKSLHQARVHLGLGLTFPSVDHGQYSQRLGQSSPIPPPWGKSLGAHQQALAPLSTWPVCQVA